MNSAVQLWKTLTPSQRATWAACAKLSPRLNSLGQTILLTDMQTFVAADLVYAAINRADQPGVTPPAQITWIPTAAPSASINIANLDLTYSYTPPVTTGTAAPGKIMAQPPLIAPAGGDLRAIPNFEPHAPKP